VKLVVPVRLYPDAAQHTALRDTLTLCNEAASLVSAQAFQMRVTSRQPLQRLVYGDLKQMGLSAQPAIHVARKVSGAYATLKANIRAGNLGDPGSKRRVKAGSKPITFRADAAQPYDDRCLSWQFDRRTVSIWTTAGRMAGIRFRCSDAQFARLREYRQGESDLVHRDGKWFLYATCDVPEPDLTDPGGFLGVDLGIANIATTDDGTRHSGKYLNRQRHRSRHLRRKLQAKGTKSAKRLLRKRSAAPVGPVEFLLRGEHGSRLVNTWPCSAVSSSGASHLPDRLLRGQGELIALGLGGGLGFGRAQRRVVLFGVASP